MIYTSLMPHQIKALNYAIRHNPCGLFMSLGSGKSLVALAVADHIKAKRILITSDKNNIINTWADQITRHTDYTYEIRPTNPQQTPVRCTLINYDLLARRTKQYLNIDWDMWIGDESAEVKDQRTYKHKGTRLITKDIPFKIILNGTLMTERLEDVYGQILLLDNGKRLGHSMTKFRNRYMMEDPRGFGWVPKRSAFSYVQRDIKSISYFIPEEDKASLKMPSRNYHTVEVEMTPEQSRIDFDLRTEFSSILEGKEIETNQATVVYLKRIQLTGGVFRPSKLDEEVVYVPTNKLDVTRCIIMENPEDKVLVWHTYIPETARLTDLMKVLDVPYVVVDSPKCQDVLEKFRSDPRLRVALVRTSLCKGLNQLVGARIGIFYSNPLSYSRRAQAEGRTCRITSEAEDTHYFDIVCAGGADKYVHQMLTQKKSLSLCLTNLRNMV